MCRIYLLMFFMLLSNIKGSLSNGVLEITFKTYNSHTEHTPRGCCSKECYSGFPCIFQFYICLSHIETNIETNQTVCIDTNEMKAQHVTILNFGEKLNAKTANPWQINFPIILGTYKLLFRINAMGTLFDEMKGNFTITKIDEKPLQRVIMLKNNVRGDIYAKEQSLEFAFSATCANNYVPPDCLKKVCFDTDDLNGHYRCNKDGNKICLDGWMNVTSNCNHKNETSVVLSNTISTSSRGHLSTTSNFSFSQWITVQKLTATKPQSQTSSTNFVTLLTSATGTFFTSSSLSSTNSMTTQVASSSPAQLSSMNLVASTPPSTNTIRITRLQSSLEVLLRSTHINHSPSQIVQQTKSLNIIPGVSTSISKISFYKHNQTHPMSLHSQTHIFPLNTDRRLQTSPTHLHSIDIEKTKQLLHSTFKMSSISDHVSILMTPSQLQISANTHEGSTSKCKASKSSRNNSNTSFIETPDVSSVHVLTSRPINTLPILTTIVISQTRRGTHYTILISRSGDKFEESTREQAGGGSSTQHNIQPSVTVTGLNSKSSLLDRRDVKYILLAIIASLVVLALLLAVCLCCQRRNMRKKLKSHKTELDELRSTALLNRKQTEMIPLKQLELDNRAYQKHKINQELLETHGSEFIGFQNATFFPDVKVKDTSYNFDERKTSLFLFPDPPPEVMRVSPRPKSHVVLSHYSSSVPKKTLHGISLEKRSERTNHKQDEESRFASTHGKLRSKNKNSSEGYDNRFSHRHKNRNNDNPNEDIFQGFRNKSFQLQDIRSTKNI